MSGPALPPGRVPAGAADALARRILADPRFAPTHPSLYDRVTGWLSRHLGSVLTGLLGGGASAFTGWLVIAVVLGATAVLVVRFGRGVRTDPGLGGDGAEPTPRPARDWLAEAGERAAAAEWRDALRCRYRALVVGLAEAGVLDEVPGRTTREHVRLVAEALPGSAGDFAGATEAFERAWYGDGPTGPDDDAALEALRVAILAAARRGRPRHHAGRGGPDADPADRDGGGTRAHPAGVGAR